MAGTVDDFFLQVPAFLRARYEERKSQSRPVLRQRSAPARADIQRRKYRRERSTSPLNTIPEHGKTTDRQSERHKPTMNGQMRNLNLHDSPKKEKVKVVLKRQNRPGAPLQLMLEKEVRKDNHHKVEKHKRVSSPEEKKRDFIYHSLPPTTYSHMVVPDPIPDTRAKKHIYLEARATKTQAVNNNKQDGKNDYKTLLYISEKDQNNYRRRPRSHDGRTLLHISPRDMENFEKSNLPNGVDNNVEKKADSRHYQKFYIEEEYSVPKRLPSPERPPPKDHIYSIPVETHPPPLPSTLTGRQLRASQEIVLHPQIAKNPVAKPFIDEQDHLKAIAEETVDAPTVEGKKQDYIPGTRLISRIYLA